MPLDKYTHCVIPQQEQSLSRLNHPAGRERPDRIKWPAGALCRINPRGHCAVARSTRQDRTIGRERSEIPSLHRTPPLRARGARLGRRVPQLPHLAAPSSSPRLACGFRFTPKAPASGQQWPPRQQEVEEPGNLEGARVVGGRRRKVERLAPDKSEGDCCGGGRSRRDHFLGCDHEVVSEREERR
ncbi:hypothetical protein PVAP13_9KG118485 [Panicum virgatum]|uniref:Uncharacterized protein n=1 Tax=Panicum virgatum TaxID=38727 RepID=A0A8T0NLG5_PANVG|nr:hypothetical protein PVAP13_9KG118485 [Panicum virgatum]